MIKRFTNKNIPISALEDFYSVSDLKKICNEYGIEAKGKEIDYIHAIKTSNVLIDFSLEDKAGLKPIPEWPEFEIGETQEGYTRSQHLIGDELIGLPYRTIIGTRENILTGEAGLINYDAGYVGDLIHSSGALVAFPAFAKFYAIYKDGEWHKVHCGSAQIRGGAEHGSGLIYSMQFVPGARRVYMLDVENMSLTNFSVEERGDNIWGAVSGNGHVFFLPASGNEIKYVHRDRPDQLESLGKVDWVKTSGKAAYTHGIFHGASGKIVCIGRNSPHVLLIDPFELSFEEIPFPQALLDAFEIHSYTFDIEVGPDGWIYTSPWNNDMIFRFCPISRRFDWKKVEIGADEITGQNYYTCMNSIWLDDHFEIFYGVARAKKTAKLKFKPENQ